MSTQPYPNALLSSLKRQGGGATAPAPGEPPKPETEREGAEYPNVLASSRRRRVELGGEAEKRPIEELQETFRATRPPVEQGEPITLPSDVHIKPPVQLPLRERVKQFVRESAIGRALGLAPETAELPPIKRLERAAEAPVLPFAELAGPPPPVPEAEQREPRVLAGRGLRSTVEAIGEFTTPQTLATIVGAGLAARTFQAIGKLIAAGFSIGLIQHAAQESAEFVERLEENDPIGAVEAAGRAGVTGFVGIKLGREALRRAPRREVFRPTAREVVRPEPRRLPAAPERLALPAPTRDIELAERAGLFRPSQPPLAQVPRRQLPPAPMPEPVGLVAARARPTFEPAEFERAGPMPTPEEAILEVSRLPFRGEAPRAEILTPEQRLIAASRENNRLLRDEELARLAERDPEINRLDDAIAQARDPAQVAELTERANARLGELRGEAEFVRESDIAEIAARPAGLPEREIAPRPKRARGRPTPQEALEQERAARAWERVLREEPGGRAEPARLPEPLPAGITEPLVEAELAALRSRGLTRGMTPSETRETAIENIQRQLRREEAQRAEERPPERGEVQRAARPEELILTFEREIADLREARQRARPEEIPQIDQRLAEAQEMLSEIAVRRRRAQLFGPAREEAGEGVLPGMEQAVREQGEAARRLQGERMTEEFARPAGEVAPEGVDITRSPLFRGTEAAPQREIFAEARPEPAPSRTLRIGRGAHGQVVVEFPDTAHADLFSFWGRIHRQIRGEQGPRAAGVRGSEALASKFGVSRERLGKMAGEYRDQVMEAVRDLEEGEKFVAPRFRSEARPTLPGMERTRPSPLFDEFGDEIVKGGRVVDSLGRSGRVVSVVPEAEVPARFRELDPSLARGYAQVEFARGRRERIPLGDLTVGRHGRPKALEGIGGRRARPFGETEATEAERFAREGGFGFGEELSANPIFNPRFWEKADAFLSEKFTKPLAQRLEGLLGKLPQGVQRWLRTDFGRFPEVKQIFQEARVEIGRVREEGDALRRIWLRTKPTPEETIAAERILRGQPEDLSTARLRPEQKAVVEQIRESAQRLTAERQALGLPVRDEWLEGPRHWYPNFFRQKLGQWIGGKLFARTGARMRPGAEALGTLKPRLSDRWWVADSTGNVVETQAGVKAIFTSTEAAEAFVSKNSGFWVSYFEKGKKGGGLQRRTFPTLRERTKWTKKQGKQITPRQMGSAHYQVVEPLTFEQMVANGLVLDPALSVSLGWSRQAELLGKTRFLGKLGEMEGVVVDAPTEGYVSLAELGFSVPRSLAERNPAIARLRDGYVYEPLARELAAFYGTVSPFNIAYRVSEGSLRKWVTYRNPWRHPRQIFENELTTALTDSGAFLDKLDQGRAFAEYARAAGGDTSVPFWKDYAASELVYTDLIRGEFQTMWRGLSEATRLQPNAPLSLTERLALWAEENPVARRVLQTDEFAQRLYRAEDQIYKWYRYSRYRNDGWTHEAAVKRTKDSYFDYSDVPVFVRVANRYIPFWVNVSFQYARIFANQVRDYPASTMLRLAVLWHAQAFVREQMLEESGMTEQDLKNMGKLAPKAWEFVLPWTDEKGRNLVLNLAWFIPFSEVALMRYAAAEEEPERGWIQFARRFVPMAAQPLVTAATQTTTFGQKVFREADTRAQKLWKLARASALSALPGLLGQYWERLYRNTQAGVRAKEPLWEKALVEPAVGRIERVAPGEKVGLRKALIAGKQRDVSWEFGRQRGRLIRGQISGEQYREEVSNLEESLREFAHPETLAVIDAFRPGGDRVAGSAAYEELLRSRYYADKGEANKAIDELARIEDRLAEARASRLPEVRELVEKVLDDYRESGPLDPAEVRRLMLAVRALPGDEKEGEEKLLREWMAEQVMEIRRRRALPQPQVPLPTRPVPREQLYAPR